MSAIDLNDYVAGGYLIIKYADAPQWDDGLLPQRLISLSSCRGKVFQIYNEWDVKYQNAVEFGVPAEKFPLLEEWRHKQIGVDIWYPDAFNSLHAARRFIAQFISNNDDILLIGIGLHHSLVEPFMATHQVEISRLRLDNVAETWKLNIKEPFGINRILSGKRPLAPRGTILGFDIAVYSLNFVCSWLCNVDENRLDEERCQRQRR